MTAPLGVLLAGGAGARLGLGRPKALAVLGGRTLLDRAAAALGEVCDGVVAAAPARLELPGCPVPRVEDAGGGAGPLAGIVAAALAHPDRVVVVLGVDFPLVAAALLRALIERLGDREAVIPSPGGRAQPLVAVYAPAALRLLAARFEAGERAVTRATAGLDALRPGDQVLEQLPGGTGAFLNVNIPADLEEAARMLGAGHEASPREREGVQKPVARRAQPIEDAEGGVRDPAPEGGTSDEP